jgi:hypothetical protein
MITKENYIEKTKHLNIAELPDNLQKAHAYVLKATENGSNWNAYENPQIRNVIDTTINKLNAHLSEHSTVKNETPVKHTTEHKPAKKVISKEAVHKPAPVVNDEIDLEFVERIPEEIRFMRRFISMNGKKKTKDDLLRFINALHRAIVEKRVRKTSPYAKQISYIQDKLVKRYNEMTKPLVVEINEKTIAEFKSLIAEQKVMPSVMLIKRYISLNGKFGVKEKAKLLMDAMTRAFNKGKITKSDKYFKIFDQMHYNLNQYVKNKSQKVLSIQEPELNGLNGFLSGCGCSAMNGDDELNGLEEIQGNEQIEEAVTQSGVMNSMDFRNMQFRTLGFVGKYRKLIGDPAKGFTAMVYGKPKMGKSFLCVDFAGYLARNHGKVLYVAREEGLDMTLQEKLKAKDVAHPNLFVAESIPQDLTPYDFIFFDSVNKLGLSAGDLEALKQANPGKSFIYIFQTTKEGNFRGANEFQHDVDIVIEVPEKGMAVQNGRYNQGGQMKIFDEIDYQQAA